MSISNTVEKLLSVRHLPTDASEVLQCDLAGDFRVMLTCYPNGTTLDPLNIPSTTKKLIDLGVYVLNDNELIIHPELKRKHMAAVERMNEMLKRLQQQGARAA